LQFIIYFEDLLVLLFKILNSISLVVVVVVVVVIEKYLFAIILNRQKEKEIKKAYPPF